MKKTALLVLTLIIASTINAQIGTTTVAVPQQKEQKPVYDSTENFLGEKNVQSYVGQILFVLPKRQALAKYGYGDFKPIDYDPESYRGPLDHYGEDAEYSKFNTKYENLVGKYFRVDSISKRSYAKYNFYLTNTNDRTDRCCFIYNAAYESAFPFMVLSHFNYLKGKYVGSQYIIKHFCIHQFDIITGDSIKIKDDLTTVWTVTDLTILDDDNNTLAYVIKSGDMTSYIEVENFDRYNYTNGGKIIFDKNGWDSLVKKYGLTMMKMVWQGEIKIGMPEILLRYSWGKPERINSSSYGNTQYVYDNDYVYVKDGKVVSWQSSH